MKLKTTNTINKTTQTNKRGNREVIAYKLVFGKNDESKTYFDGRVCEHYKVPGLKTKIGVYKTIDEAMTQFRNLVFRKGTKTYNIIIDDETINEVKKEFKVKETVKFNNRLKVYKKETAIRIPEDVYDFATLTKVRIVQNKLNVVEKIEK
jgi:hypothetical protein